MMNKFQIKLIKSFCCLKMEQLHFKKTGQASVLENGAALFKNRHSIFKLEDGAAPFKNGASLKMEPNKYMSHIVSYLWFGYLILNRMN